MSCSQKKELSTIHELSLYCGCRQKMHTKSVSCHTICKNSKFFPLKFSICSSYAHADLVAFAAPQRAAQTHISSLPPTRIAVEKCIIFTFVSTFIFSLRFMGGPSSKITPRKEKEKRDVCVCEGPLIGLIENFIEFSIFSQHPRYIHLFKMSRDSRERSTSSVVQVRMRERERVPNYGGRSLFDYESRHRSSLLN